MENAWKKLILHRKHCFKVLLTRQFGSSKDFKVPTISASYIREKLVKNKVEFVDGFTCYKIAECKFCGPARKKPIRSADMFINKHTGFFLCELCRCIGSWEIFERLSNRTLQEGEPTVKEIFVLKDGITTYYEKGHQSWKKVTSGSRLLSDLSDEEYFQAFQDFNLTLLDKSVIEKLNVYLAIDFLYFPIYSSSQLVGYMSLDKSGNTLTQPKKDCAGYLLFSSKRKQTSAVIVSNIPDFFSLISLNLPYHIICLPYGVLNLPQTVLPFFESYDSLTLWLGSVVGAWDATKSFCKKLNERRCFVVRGLDNILSPCDAVAKGADVRRILADARATWHQSITTFSSLRKDVLVELINYEQVLGVQWTRFPVLNRILKGHRRGELTVLTGPTGSGKTTFMSEYSLDLASQGVNTLWGSFEVRNVRLAKTMLQQHIGKPLEQNLMDFDKMADDFEKLPIYFLTFHGQQSIKAVMDAVRHAAYVHDIAHVIIDNVQFMIGMSEEDARYIDRFYKQDLIIHSFRTFATKSNCHVTLVIHPRKEKDGEDLTTASVFGGAKAVQEADNVLIIQDRRLTSVKGKKFLQVLVSTLKRCNHLHNMPRSVACQSLPTLVYAIHCAKNLTAILFPKFTAKVTKNRYTGDLGMMPLDFDKGSLSFKTRKKKAPDETIEQLDLQP